jgi:hypothetical protein
MAASYECEGVVRHDQHRRLARTNEVARHAVHEVCLDPAVDLLLSPIRRGDKSVESTELESQANQANATRSDLYKDKMESENQAMQESQSEIALKKLGDLRADVEGILLPAPSLPGGAGDLKLLGRLTLRDSLSLQLKYRCHRGLPLKPWRNEK